MKLMNFVAVLVIICGLIQMGFGEKLNCQFIIGYDGYTCFVRSLDNTNNTMVISGYSGIHEENKTDTDVTVIEIQNTNTKYIPTGLGSLFNLTKLQMLNTQLNDIKAQDFIGMEELIELYLNRNKLTSVPIDVFSTLTKLKLLSLTSNQIEEIPNGVFANNLQLEKIWLHLNRIKFLGSTLFDDLTKLTFVSLWNNICINKAYYNGTGIIELKNDIQQNCTNVQMNHY